MIYLDANATTKCDQEVVQSMLPYFSDLYGNASSKYYKLAIKSQEAIKSAQTKAEKLFKCEEGTIQFTSGATESNNLIISGVLKNLSMKQKPVHIITSSIEHKSVLNSFLALS